MSIESANWSYFQHGDLYVICNTVDKNTALRLTHDLFTLRMEQRIGRSIFDLEFDRMQWSLRTFPEATALSSLCKLRTEIDEIEQDINIGKVEPLEYADALMCLFDSANRHGISMQSIFEAFSRKNEINKSRTWFKNEDNSYSHHKK